MNVEDLFLCPICRNIPADKREMFFNDLTFRNKFFKKGERIANQGDTVNALYILLKGSVKAEMVSGSGAILNIEIIKAPSALASAFLFAKNNKFPVDVIALEDCKLSIISKDLIMKQLAGNETFLREYMSFNSDRVYFLSERLKVLSIKTIKGKIAQYILTRTDNIQFNLDRNKTELSEYFGVARPSLSRSLSEMIADGIISLKRNSGKILDIARLKALINR